MAQILDIFQATDGLDVTCEANGQRRVYHFAEPPAAVQAAVDELEAAEAPPAVVVIVESGEVIDV